MTLRWYAVRTKPQSEYIAAAALRREGIELFFPCIRTPWPRRGHGDAPVIPGYLFLRCDVERDRRSVNRLPGIWGWVRFEGVVPPIPDEVITDLAGRLDSINQGGGVWLGVRRGEKVRVIQGAIDRLAEVIEDPESPHGRVRVIMDFMGRLVHVEVPWQDIRPAREVALTDERWRNPRRTRGGGRWTRGAGPRAAAAV